MHCCGGSNYRECINETKLFCINNSAVMLECNVCVNTTHKQCVL